MTIEVANKKESWALTDAAKEFIKFSTEYGIDKDLAIELAIQIIGEQGVYKLDDVEKLAADRAED